MIKHLSIGLVILFLGIILGYGTGFKIGKSTGLHELFYSLWSKANEQTATSLDKERYIAALKIPEISNASYMGWMLELNDTTPLYIALLNTGDCTDQSTDLTCTAPRTMLLYGADPNQVVFGNSLLESLKYNRFATNLLLIHGAKQP